MTVYFDEHHLNHQNTMDDLKNLLDKHVSNGGDLTNISFEVVRPKPIFGVKQTDSDFWSRTEGCPYLRVLIFSEQNKVKVEAQSEESSAVLDTIETA